MTIKLSEKDCKNLSTLPFQRTPSIRSSLVKSMQQYGFLGSILTIKTSIIDGIEKLYIADGQHRYLAARFLKIAIPADIIHYTGTKEGLVHMISTLNSTGIKWTTLDYIKAFASLGNKSYVTLLQTINLCDKITTNTILKVSGCYSTAIIRKGGLVYVEANKDKLIRINDLLKSLPKQTRDDIVALGSIIDLRSFNEKRFKEKYMENQNILRPLLPQERVKIYKQWFK